MLGQEHPFPSLADVFYLAMYPIAAAGLVLLIRRRTGGRDRGSLLDALSVTTALALLSWIFLIDPYVQDAGAHVAGTRDVDRLPARRHPPHGDSRPPAHHERQQPCRRPARRRRGRAPRRPTSSTASGSSTARGRSAATTTSAGWSSTSPGALAALRPSMADLTVPVPGAVGRDEHRAHRAADGGVARRPGRAPRRFAHRRRRRTGR